jgi:hypothetical protein
MSLKMPPERFRYSTGGAPGIAAGDDEHLGLADLAGLDARLRGGERRVVAALEADQARYSRVLHVFAQRCARA